MPQYTNPAEYALELVNTDFSSEQDQAESKLRHLMSQWDGSTDKSSLESSIAGTKPLGEAGHLALDPDQRPAVQRMMVPIVLIHRNFIKSYRDVFAYGIRVAMYVCLAIMAGTVWLRLVPSQDNIQAFTNTIVSRQHIVAPVLTILVLWRGLYEFHGCECSIHANELV
jgi:hypothetical protein